MDDGIMLDSTLRWKKSCLTFTTYYSCSIQHLKYIFIKFLKIAESNKKEDRLEIRFVSLIATFVKSE